MQLRSVQRDSRERHTEDDDATLHSSRPCDHGLYLFIPDAYLILRSDEMTDWKLIGKRRSYHSTVLH